MRQASRLRPRVKDVGDMGPLSGSAPLDWASFRAALLGQLGEARLKGQSTPTLLVRTIRNGHISVNEKFVFANLKYLVLFVVLTAISPPFACG
jgi:hypothetical protein